MKRKLKPLDLSIPKIIIKKCAKCNKKIIGKGAYLNNKIYCSKCFRRLSYKEKLKRLDKKRCKALTNYGTRCRNYVVIGDFCSIHY